MIETVQGFDPAGVAARDLSECLLHSGLRRSGEAIQFGEPGVRHHLEELSRRKLPEIARQFHVSLDDVQDAAESHREVGARPGRPFSAEDEQTVLPDVVVERDGDGYTVSLNDDEIPSLRIGDGYEGHAFSVGRGSRGCGTICGRRFVGRFFIRCVQQRQAHTLEHRARNCRTAARFLRTRPAPLTAHDYESKWPRQWVCTKRRLAAPCQAGYMATPRGLFELKYFSLPATRQTMASR